MVGFEDEYERIEEYAQYNRMVFGEWIFFAFALDPKSEVAKCLGKTEHYKNTSSMKELALDLLENGEVIFRMSEKYRSAGGIAC